MCFFFSSCYYISVMGEKHEALAVSEKTEETNGFAGGGHVSLLIFLDSFFSFSWSRSHCCLHEMIPGPHRGCTGSPAPAGWPIDTCFCQKAIYSSLVYLFSLLLRACSLCLVASRACVMDSLLYLILSSATRINIFPAFVFLCLHPWSYTQVVVEQ